jgi:hypothetical protein
MSHGGGGDNFGMMIIFFLVILFIVWIFSGAADRSDSKDKPFIKEYTTQTVDIKAHKQ